MVLSRERVPVVFDFYITSTNEVFKVLVLVIHVTDTPIVPVPAGFRPGGLGNDGLRLELDDDVSMWQTPSMTPIWPQP